MKTGWIKIFRSLTEWEWYTDANTFRVFLHILLTANFEEKNWRGTLVRPGDLITSYEKLSKELDLSLQSVRTSIRRLKSTGEVTSKSTNKYTVISILNYKDYQEPTGKLTNEQQTTNKQLTTTKEYKNDKNEKKDTTQTKKERVFKTIETITDDVLIDIAKTYEVEQYEVKKELESLRLYCQSTGKSYKDYKATLQNWVRRKVEDGKIKVQKRVFVQKQEDDVW